MKTRILIAEDETPLREGLIATLESEGYGVLACGDGATALELWERESPDLLLLDVMMPEKSGYDVCREVRRRDAGVPIILLTARGEEIDKVVGLELGADDYVTKPFGIHELRARIAAVLRRTRPSVPEDGKPLPDLFPFGAAVIDRKRFEGKAGTETFRISAREMTLLGVFAERPDEVLSRNELLNAAWGIDYLGTTRTLDQHIAQLRKKIEPDPARPTVLETVHGIGYRYRPVRHREG